MRKFLGSLNGQWVNIVGELRFFGKAPRKDGFNYPVMLIVNAKANGIMEIDHLWVPIYRRQADTLREGAIVAFRAKVIPYYKQGGKKDFAVTGTFNLRVVTQGNRRTFNEYWSTINKGRVPCR